MYGDFFRGDVRFVSQGIINAKYSIVDNGSIIKVKNSTHIRLLLNQYGNFPDKFEIIAPIAVVTLISGEIPGHYVKYLHASEYLKLRQQYQGV
jgi:hypothetical protein|tara:strand:- start:734 stop:1012 length:279 start_codon:yes stop_codon:yes gene_type:complete